MANKTPLDAIMEKMRDKDSLPALSESVLEISRLARNPETSSADLASVIMRDCGLTTSLLVTVNSSLYTPVSPIETVTSAVTFIGFDKVYLLAIGLTIFKNTMETLRKKKLLKLYASSYFSGSLAMSLANEYQYPNPEEIFVAGLLYRLPRMSLANTFPKRFHAMEKLVHENNMTYNQACLKVFKVRYDDICNAIMELYRLPGKVSKIFAGKESSGDVLVSLIHEAASVASMLFQDKAGGKTMISEVEARIRPLLKNDEFSIAEFIKNTCKADKNITRFFNLNQDDVEIMVNLLEWGKANPAEVVTNLSFGEAIEKEVTTKDKPELLVGQFLTELSLCRRQGGDINQILMLAQEALYRCLAGSEIFVAFLDSNKSVLIGRFYAGSSLKIKAENFRIDVKKKKDSPIVQCLAQQILLHWMSDQKPLHLPFVITKYLKLKHSVIVPIVVSGQPIGVYFIGRIGKDPFNDREQAWIELIIDHVEMGFNSMGSQG